MIFLAGSLVLLGIARLLPEHGFGLWLRLAAATLVLLAPGRLLARGVASMFVFSVALVAAALAITFAVHGSLDLTLLLLLVATLAALPFRRHVARCNVPVLVAGIGLGIALWSIEGIVKGDGLFHLGRVRKLDDFGSLSLRAVDEFKDGGLHPGYAFPLWHGWLALVAKLAGVDPTSVVLHESTVLAPLALLLAFELGRQVFRSRWPAYGVLLAQAGIIVLAPGGGGAYTSLDLPGTAARQLLVPALVALFFAFVRAPSWWLAAALAAAGVDLAFVHPTYAIFVAIPLVGYALLRLPEVRANAAGLAAFGVPALLVLAWLAPLASETSSHDPNSTEKARAFATYANDLVVHSLSSYHVEPALVARTGAIAIAALVLTPLAALAARRRWSALVLGGAVLVLALELWSLVFPHFSDLVSLSQSRRAAGFVPFAVALAGGAAVLTRALRLLVLPVALAAGIVLQLEYPGDFGMHIVHAAPGIVTWIALFGGLVGVVVALVRRGLAFERHGPVSAAAVALFVLPVAIHGFANWDAPKTPKGNELTPGLVAYLRAHVPKRAVVYADLETSYRISAYVPVYVAVAPPEHVADTKANRPYARRAAFLRFLDTGDVAIPRRYGATWLVLRRHQRVGPGAHLVYRDGGFRVYRL